MKITNRELGEGVEMEKLKPCPFCGGEAELMRTAVIVDTDRFSQIKDRWIVKCKRGCCRSCEWIDNICHRPDGELVIAANGAEDAVEMWNKRA